MPECHMLTPSCLSATRDCGICDGPEDEQPAPVEEYDCDSVAASCFAPLGVVSMGEDCCGCADGVQPCADACDDVPEECQGQIGCPGVCLPVEVYHVIDFLAAMCPEEFVACESDCMDELEAAILADAEEPPTTGSAEFMAMVDCAEAVEDGSGGGEGSGGMGGAMEPPYDECAEMYPSWDGDGWCDVPDYCFQGDFTDCGFPEDMLPGYEPPQPVEGDSCHYQNDNWCDAADMSSDPYCEAGSDFNDCGLCHDDDGNLACGALFCLGCDYVDPWDASMLPGTPHTPTGR
jgi:hypothetical protein